MKKGIFITFEGVEGSGKTTQANLLYNFLRRKGQQATLLLKEPGGTKISNKIRKILLDSKNFNMCPEAELLLFLASRSQIVREIIIPALRKKMIVICDRFYDSTFAYQHYGRKLPYLIVNRFNTFSTGKLIPDITFFLDTNVKTGLKRAYYLKRKKDRIENENINFLNKVRKGYLRIAKNNKKRPVVAIKPKSIIETQKIIRKKLNERFNRLFD